MRKRLNYNIILHKILIKFQYHFIENSTTKYAILEFMDYAYDSINNSECLFVVYIDLFKALYTVNQKIGAYWGKRENF